MKYERGKARVVAGCQSESITLLLHGEGASHLLGCCTYKERVTYSVVAYLESESCLELLQVAGASQNHRCCMAME